MPEPDDPYPEHWYDVVEDNRLRQGDVFRDLLVYWMPPEQLPDPDAEEPEEEEVEVTLQYSRGDWIVLTASCDLEQRRFSYVLLAGLYEANREHLGLQQNAPEDELRKYQEIIRQGLDNSKFLLPRYEDIDPTFPRSVAYIRTNVFLPLEYLEANCEGERLRLRHPFREKFGNWVGRRFSEVGPEDYALIDRIYHTSPPHALREAEAERARQAHQAREAADPDDAG